MKAKLGGLISVIACIVLADTTAWAGTCTSATLDTYFASGFSCTVGDVEFSNFSDYNWHAPVDKAVIPYDITVTPSGSDATSLNLLFDVNLSADVNETNTISFDYTATPLAGFALTEPGYSWAELFSGTGYITINSHYAIPPDGFPTTSPLEDYVSIGAVGGSDGSAIFTYYGDAWGVTATPVPGSLPLFASGISILGLLGWRRKRKNAAAIAA